MKITEVTTPTPEQQRIKAMQAQLLKRAQEAVRAERQRQQVAKAQQNLTKARAVKP